MNYIDVTSARARDIFFAFETSEGKVVFNFGILVVFNFGILLTRRVT